MITKTLVPQIKDSYSSFPTFTEHDNRIFVFYRQGIKSDAQIHGVHGRVKCFEIDKGLCLNQFENNKIESLYELGKDYTIFEGKNEIDAIVSRLEDNVFSLSTRIYIKKQPMETYVSFSDVPYFKERKEIIIRGAEWIVFYGKAFKWEQGYVFPAYGELSELEGERPLLLITDDFSSWEVLSYLPGNFYGFTLNESSIVFDGEKYFIFMREETKPFAADTESFGIWYSTSNDLQKWSPPEKLISWAHAPMTVFRNGRIYLTFRELVSDDTTIISLISPFSDLDKLIIDTYKGNPYDGGYTDIGIIDERLFVIYYTGNDEGEPYLKICEIDGDYGNKN